MHSIASRDVHDIDSATNDHSAETSTVVLEWETVSYRHPNSTRRRPPLDPSAGYRTVAAFCGVPESVKADKGGRS
jgi:hypothetical protein